MAYVYSTLANNQIYTNWISTPSGTPIKGSTISIMGGAGVMGKDKRLITPLGKCTFIDDSLVAELEKNYIFNEHKKNGFVTIVNNKKQLDIEKVVPDLSCDEGSRPRTPSDYINANKETDAVPLEM